MSTGSSPRMYTSESNGRETSGWSIRSSNLSSPQGKNCPAGNLHYLRDVIIYDHPEKSPGRPTQTGKYLPYPPDQSHDSRRAAARSSTISCSATCTALGLLEPLMHDPALEDIELQRRRTCRSLSSTGPLWQPSHQRALPQGRTQPGMCSTSWPRKQTNRSRFRTRWWMPPLPDGSRLQVTYSNVISTNGSSIYHPQIPCRSHDPARSHKVRDLQCPILAFLWLVIEHRRSLIIPGGTASGKTSTMNAVSSSSPSTQRSCHWRIPGRSDSPTRTGWPPRPGNLGTARDDWGYRPLLAPEILDAAAPRVYHRRRSERRRSPDAFPGDEYRACHPFHHPSRQHSGGRQPAHP